MQMRGGKSLVGTGMVVPKWFGYSAKKVMREEVLAPLAKRGNAGRRCARRASCGLVTGIASDAASAVRGHSADGMAAKAGVNRHNPGIACAPFEGRRGSYRLGTAETDGHKTCANYTGRNQPAADRHRTLFA